MFGRMTAEAILRVGPRCEVKAAAKALVEATETGEVVRWVEFPAALLVFVVVPGDMKSGTIYVLDRQPGIWYWVDFEDEEYGGYSRPELERLLRECGFLALVERPGLLRSGLRWVLEPGKGPEVVI